MRLRERNKVLETLHAASQQSSAAVAPAASLGAPASSGPSYLSSIGGSSVRFSLPDSSVALPSPTFSVSPKLPVAELQAGPGSGV